MITLSTKEITKAYGTDVILDKVSFHVCDGDRVGIIGANGAGKTTLLKILTGELVADSGDFFISADSTIGYLKQADDFHSDKTLIEEVESIFAPLKDMEDEMAELTSQIDDETEERKAAELIAKYTKLREEYEAGGGYRYKSEMRGILKSMAFGEEFFDKPVATLSGGERTRLALACLLLKNPTLLMLDEPTNHLDIGTLNWLEQYLKGYRGTLIIVSHDRYFLNKTTNRIFEIAGTKLTVYEGSYSYYAEEKKRRREDALRKYNAQQADIKKQEEIIRRFKGHGTEKLAKRAASRERMLERMKPTEKPTGEGGKVKIHFKEKFKSGNDVLFAGDLSKTFGYGISERKLFENVDMNIVRGERICVVGPNGVGKTTLLKILMGDTEPSGGHVKVGHNVTFGYYDQGQRLLDENNTVLEEMRDAYSIYTDTEMRSMLGRFLFTGDDVLLPIRALSGGEKARLTLLKLMLSGANVLVLDEPTNHLDIDSKEIFEDALLDFPGTSIVVSHDRYFLSKIPTKIMELTPGGMEVYLGKYDYYLEKKEEFESGKRYLRELAKEQSVPKAETKIEKTGKLSPAEERRIKKEAEAERRREKRRRQQLESDIETLEEEIEKLEIAVASEEIANDYQKLEEIGKLLAKRNEELTEKYEDWEKMQ